MLRVGGTNTAVLCHELLVFNYWLFWSFLEHIAPLHILVPLLPGKAEVPAWVRLLYWFSPIRVQLLVDLALWLEHLRGPGVCLSPSLREKYLSLSTLLL
jgi:hypothetical protein